MRYDRRTLAGLVFAVGTVQFLLAVLAAEGMRPGYSVSTDTISELGGQSTAPLFNTSVVVLGLLTLVAAYLYHGTHRRLWITVPFSLAGIGAVGVGVFPLTTGAPHLVSALTAFLFGGVLALLTSLRTRPPFRYLSIFLGALGLVALVLWRTGTYLGLGDGGMERMIAYPVLFWGIAFGGYLMSSTSPAEELAEAESPAL